MPRVMASTSMDRSKMECAGVPAGANILVGDCGLTAYAGKEEQVKAAKTARSFRGLVLRELVVCCAKSGSKNV